ncbi:MAG: hypothetical protein ACK2T3_14470 [Candidatus Promineifilaceae bacterium]
MIKIEDSWGDMPPSWSIYFLTDNLADSVKKVQELGGSVVVPPTPAGEMGEFAVIQDHHGAYFSHIQFAVPADPPPGQ